MPTHEEIVKIFEWNEEYTNQVEDYDSYIKLIAERFGIAPADLEFLVERFSRLYMEIGQGVVRKTKTQAEAGQTMHMVLKNLMVRAFSVGSEIYQRHTQFATQAEVAMTVSDIEAFLSKEGGNG